MLAIGLSLLIGFPLRLICTAYLDILWWKGDAL